MGDPEFLAEAKKRNVEVELVTAEVVINVLKKAAASPPSVLEHVKRALYR